MPELIPARMINEFTYCPRLFHLEWVQTEWADNTDTAEGTWQHRVVDETKGHAGLTTDKNVADRPLRVATSVELSSERYGLVGKIDLLEVAKGGVAVPVDYKRGSAPDLDEGAYDPERVQLAVQGLLLREAGYECTYGELYFAESRERVRIDFTPELLAFALQQILDLRKVAMSDQIPAPLVDSRKCPRCSLAGICLPDETNLLADGTSPRTRRLIAANPDARPLYVVEQGARVSKSKGRVVVKQNKETLHSVRLIDVAQVSIFGNVQVSTQAMREFFKRDIPVMWFSYGGWFSGLAHGMPSKNVVLRLGQAKVAEQGAVEVARRMISAKIRSSRTMLMRNAKPRPEQVIVSLRNLATQAENATEVESLLGIEGAAAAQYFGVFGAMLRSPDGCDAFDFGGRNRRPPRDPVNALLSLCYSLLVKDVVAAALAVGFDPYLGVYHRPKFGKPALALDLMEEFRPLIAESVVLRCVNNGVVQWTDFVAHPRGVSLTNDGRRAVIAAYERRMNQTLTHPLFGYEVSYRRALELHARMLAAVMKGELDEYVGLVTR